MKNMELAQAIKERLAYLASEDELPMDMTALDAGIITEVIDNFGKEERNPTEDKFYIYNKMTDKWYSVDDKKWYECSSWVPKTYSLQEAKAFLPELRAGSNYPDDNMVILERESDEVRDALYQSIAQSDVAHANKLAQNEVDDLVEVVMECLNVKGVL